MESDVSGFRSRVVLKTVSRLPGTFINQLYAVDLAVAAWVSLSSLSYTACALYLANQGRNDVVEEQVAAVEWTFQVQTAAFGAVLLLNVLNLGMRQHLLPFKCNLLLLFINSVAFVTDLLLWRRATLITASTSGRLFAPLRYVQWCHSTPTMIYMLALMADCSGWKLLIALLSDVAMVVSGLAAAYTVGLAKGACTFVSFGTFAVVVYYMERMFHKALSGDISPEQRGTLHTVLALLLVLWSAFPVVWLAAELHLIAPYVEAVCWGVCDYLAKVVFSSQLWQSNLTGVQLRRDRALEAWEASNRVEAVARLTALLKQRDDLLSTLSHELRTPLAGIVALTESLCKDVPAALPACGHTLFTLRATATCMLNIITSTLDSFAARRGELTEGLLPAHGGDAAAAAAAAADVGSPGSGTRGEACGISGGGGGAVPLGVVDLRPLIETVTLVLRPLAHDGVAVVNDLPHQLPLVTADATRLSQVLYNLVGNAMRFTSNGEVRISAKVILPEGAEPTAAAAAGRTTATRGDAADADADAATATARAGVTGAANTPSGGGSRWRYRRPRVSASTSTSSTCSCQGPLPSGSVVEVSVEDTGVGIPQDLLDELFLPYRTGIARRSTGVRGSSPPCPSSSSSAFGGTGLGLYLVRLALRAQGCDVTAESAPGLGSVFRFRLPVAPHHLQHQQHPTHRQDNKRGKADADPSPLQPCDEGDGVAAAALTAAAHHGLGDQGSGPRASLDAVPNRGAVSEQNTGGVRTSSPGSPPTWVASAKARLLKVSGSGRGGCSNGGAAAGTPAGPPPATAFQASPPHSAQLERLRRSLDEQRCQRRAAQAANAVAGDTATAATATVRPCFGGAGRGRKVALCDATQLGRRLQPPGDVSGCSLGVGVGGACTECTASNGASPFCDSSAPSVKAAMATSVLTGSASFPAGFAGTAVVPTRLLAPSLEGSDVAAVAEAHARAQVPARQNYRHRNNGTLQVMSVDDDPINQLVAGQMISSQSWKVVKCMNGPEALAHLRLSPSATATATASAQGDSQPVPPSPGGGGGPQPSSHNALAAAVAAALPLLPSMLPDIVLLDVMMPGMSGFEVCRRLREHFSPAELAIIIVSAKGDSAAVEEAFESGADDYMTKPLKRSEMVARIKAQIRIRDSAAAAVAHVAPVSAATPSWTTASSHILSPIPGAGSGPGTLTGVGPAGTQLPAPSGRCASAARGLVLGGLRSDRPASVNVLVLPHAPPSSSGIGSVATINGDSTGGGVGTAGGGGGRLRQMALHYRSDSADAVPPDGGLLPGESELLCPSQSEAQVCGLSAVATAPAVVQAVSPNASQSSTSTARRLRQPSMTTSPTVGSGGAPDEAPPPPATTTAGAATTTGADAVQPLLTYELRTGGSAAAAVADSAVGTSSSLLHVLPASASVAPTDVTLGGGAGVAGDAVSAMMQEVLSEVRRGRAVEADVAKLHSRMASLQAACGTLAAERDGWRRQARDLRALLAAGVGGNGGAAAAAAAAASPPPSMSSHAMAGSAAVMAAAMATSNGAAARRVSSGAAGAGGCLSPNVHEHLACSRSSVDSGGGAVLLATNGAGPVAAQLEDLKREAAKLRQQLSIALASMGNGSISTALITGLSCGDPGNGSRALGVPSSANTRAELSGPPATPPADSAPASGGTDPVPSGPEPTSPWAVTVIPNPTFVAAGNGPDLFLTTTVSGLSGDQVEGHASGDGAVAAAAAGPRQSTAVRTPVDLLEPARSPAPIVPSKPARSHSSREARPATDATGPQASSPAPAPAAPAATLDADGALAAVETPADLNGAASGAAVATAATSPSPSLSPVNGEESAVATVSDLRENSATTASNACPSLAPTGRRSDEDVLPLQAQQSQQSQPQPQEQQQQCSSAQPPVVHAAAAAAPAAPVASSPSGRSSRSRAGVRGPSGTGLLRLLCSKGALPGASSGGERAN